VDADTSDSIVTFTPLVTGSYSSAPSGPTTNSTRGRVEQINEDNENFHCSIFTCNKYTPQMDNKIGPDYLQTISVVFALRFFHIWSWRDEISLLLLINLKVPCNYLENMRETTLVEALQSSHIKFKVWNRLKHRIGHCNKLRRREAIEMNGEI
jgi:hypothetical protein